MGEVNNFERVHKIDDENFSSYTSATRSALKPREQGN